MSLQQEYQELTNKLTNANNQIIRLETTLEQKQKELVEAKENLKQLTTTDDLEQVNQLLNTIDTELSKLYEEAQKILSEV